MMDADWIHDLFYAVGFQGYLSTSSDGLNWTQLASPTTATLRRIAAITEGGYVAVGDDETIVIAQPMELLGIVPLWPETNDVADLVAFQNGCP